MSPPSSDPPDRDQLVPLERVVASLSAALGSEKSAELVIGAARDLGLNENRLTLGHTLDILTALGSSPGIVGVAARFAGTRLLSGRRKGSSGSHQRVDAATAPTDAPRTTQAPEGPERVVKTELVTLLANTVGTEKSRQLVGATMAELGLTGATLARDEALVLLDTLAEAQGVVGIAARFAKARLILKFENG